MRCEITDNHFLLHTEKIEEEGVNLASQKGAKFASSPKIFSDHTYTIHFMR